MSHRFRKAAPAVTLCDVTHLCVYARSSLARRLGIKESELAFEHAKGQGYAATLTMQDKHLRFRGPIRGLGYGPDVAIAELAAAQNALFQMDCAEASQPKDRDPRAPIDIPASAGLMVVVGDKQLSRGKPPLDHSWASGVLRAEWHARRNRCQATLDSVAAGELPVDCGVPFIDATSAIVNERMESFSGRRDLWLQGFDAFLRSIPRSTPKHEAKNLLQPLSVPFSVGGPNTTLTVLPIPDRQLHAYGIGKGRRQSLGIALYHRNVMLKKLQAESAAEVAGDASELDVGGAEVDLGVDSVRKPQQPQAPLPPKEPIDPNAVERLLSLFASANGMDTPQWRAVEVAAVPGGSRFHHVGYELAVGPTSTQGSGNTPGQAQHAALESMHATLLSMDPNYAAFVNEVRGAVKIDDLNSSVELRLPQRLRDRIIAVASPIAARVRKEEAEDERSVLDENETGLTDGTGVFMRSATGRGDAEKMSLDLRDRRRAARAGPALERIQAVRAALPIAAARDDIIGALADTRVVVLCGTTGSGKTTQVPQFLLDAALEQLRGADYSVVVTQPRRISAVSVAERISSERGEELGESCGYAVRLDSVRGRNINIVTVGVLLQGLRRDPHLKGVDVLILDEVHDRSTDIDLALAFAKNALAANDGLKLIVMSATLQSELYARYFDGAARVINVDGRLHPVKEYFLDDLARLPDAPASCRYHDAGGGGGNDRRFSRQQHYRRNAAPSVDHGLVMWTAERAIKSKEVPAGKSILVFVPGWKDLSALQRLAAQSRVARFHTIVLHSSVDKKDQMLAFRPPPEGTVKLVLATNIAETGITIDDVGAVIDTGLVRMKTTDISRSAADSGEGATAGAPDSYMASVDHLTVTHISKASAMQRKGRAGRTAGGTCYRLYSKSQAETLSEFQEPEILRTALEGVLLRLAAMKLPVSAFLASLIDPPALHKVAHAAQRLHVLGAAELPEDFDPADDERCQVGRLKLTHMGRWLSRIPVDPGLGKLVVLGAMLECLDPALTVAACAEHTPFITAREAAKRVDESRGALSCMCGSDQLVNVLAFNELAFAQPRDRRRVAATNMLSELSVFNISRIKEQLRTILAEGGFIDRPDAYEAQRPAATLHSYNDGAPLCVDEGPASDHECINTLSLLRVLIAASLYPNVGIALRRTGGGGGKRRGKKNRHQQDLDDPAQDPAAEPLNIMRLRTQHDERLRLAGSSVVRVDTAKPGSCRDPLVAFDKPMRIDGRSPRVSRATQVSMWGLLVLAAAPHHVTYNAAVGVGRVGRWLTFRCRRESFEGVTDLRDAMTHCMARVAADPRDIDAREQLRALRSILCDLLEDSSSVEVHGSDDEADSDQDDSIQGSGGSADPEHGRRPSGHGGGHHQHKHRGGSHHHQEHEHRGGHPRPVAAPREDLSGFGEPVFEV